MTYLRIAIVAVTLGLVYPVFTDGSDWRCRNGDLIHISYRCDGAADCYDGSDEHECYPNGCPEAHFTCVSDNKCIPHALRCNLYPDCSDSSDETDCEEIAYCRADQFYCNMDCIPLEWVCDGEDDCGNEADEKNCSSFICPLGEVRCNLTNICISSYWICDGESDCADGINDQDDEDERNCQPPEFIVNTDLLGEPASECYLRKNLTVWNDEMHYESLVCDQVCLKNMDEAKCACIDGYTTDPTDSTHCLLNNDSTVFLFYVSENQIMRRDLRSPEWREDVIFRLPDFRPRILTMEHDVNTNTLIWVELETGNINFLRIDDAHHIVLRMPSAVALALDWLTPNLYVACRGTSATKGHVNVVPLLRTQVNNIKKIKIAEFVDPVSIALFLNKGIMLVADQGNSLLPSKLVYLNMDGSDPRDFEVELVRTIHCVTIDYVTEVVYWSESNMFDARIEMKTLDGNLKRTLIARSMDVVALRSPFSLAVYENKVVFSDNRTGDIWRIDSMLGKPEGYPHLHEPLHKGLDTSRLLGVKVSYPSLQIYNQDVDACKSATCSYACALRPNGFRCLCPSGMIIDTDLSKCVGIQPQSESTTSQSSSVTTTTAITVQQQHEVQQQNTFYQGHESVIEIDAIQCILPYLPDSVEVVGNPAKHSFDVGEKLVLKCGLGRHVLDQPMATEFSVTCLSSARWNASIASCIEWTCLELDCGQFGSCVSTDQHAAVCKCANGEFGFQQCMKASTSTSTSNLVSDLKTSTSTEMVSPSQASKLPSSSLSTPTNISSLSSNSVAFLSTTTSSVARTTNSTLAPPERSDPIHDVISVMLSSYMGKVVGAVAALVLVGLVVGYLVHYCLKRSRNSFEVHYTAQPRRKRPGIRSQTTRGDETSVIDNNNCITNPNYSSPTTPKLRLAPPDDKDSGVDRSSSSLSSNDSPPEPINYNQVTPSCTLASLGDLDEYDHVSVVQSELDRRRPGLRRTFRSMFNIRKSESREHMLPKP
uniref:Low-density lipoprotein receptor 1-like n=1 Tax=Phallusia mammillata TaxID=59560 RepID=A0A6F9DNK7_9ASCI|nr:low-density lipoprotein receptor 1-like [Phallusia mammillata]